MSVEVKEETKKETEVKTTPDVKQELATTDDKPEIKLPETNELVVSTSPHLHDGGSVRKIMFTVVIAMMPACIAGVYFFGIDALQVLLLCTVSCVGFEMLWNKMAGKTQTISDGSAIVTGILLGMNLSAGVPWWVCVLGGMLAICLGKQIFGGLGYNPFNPALVARVGLLIGLPQIMTTWATPRNFEYMEKANIVKPDGAASNVFFNAEQLAGLDKIGGSVMPFMKDVEAVTCATPLGVVTTTAEMAKDAGIPEGADPFGVLTNSEAMWNYFWGNVGGCVGETSAAALILGGIILLACKLIKWHIPVAYIGSTMIFTFIINKIDPTLTPGPIFHVITGGLLLGAFFMATDMVTSPMTNKGALVFGMGCGIVTCCIRIWGSYPEGVSFSILFMNALVPLIDRYTIGKPFGFRKPEPTPEEK